MLHAEAENEREEQVSIHCFYGLPNRLVKQYLLYTSGCGNGWVVRIIKFWNQMKKNESFIGGVFQIKRHAV